VYLPARVSVEEAWKKRKDIDESGEFISFDNSVPWKGHVLDLEKENKCEGLIKFAFYKDDRGMSRVQALPLAGHGFQNRVSLCAAWRGLRGDDLKKVSGFNDIEFVHHAGFIGGAWSSETCIKMAKQSLEEHQKEQEGRQT
jgi:uncharacterized UPF0160 family protein